MQSKYNYCSKCAKWLGWLRYLVFWETNKLCSNCQNEPKAKPIDIF